MTTFTTEDRLSAEAIDYENDIPIPFVGWMRHEPVMIVESGASVPKEDQLTASPSQ